MEGKLIMKRVRLSALMVAVVLAVSVAVSSAEEETPSVMETMKRFFGAGGGSDDKVQDESKLGSDNFGTATLDDIINPDDLFAAGPSPDGAPAPSPTSSEFSGEEEAAAYGVSSDGGAPSDSPTSAADDAPASSPTSAAEASAAGDVEAESPSPSNP